MNYETEWSKFTKEGYENTLNILENLKSLNTNINVIYQVKGWIIHEGLLLGLSQNKKMDDLKRLDFLNNSVLKTRGIERDYTLRALSELKYFVQRLSYSKKLYPEVDR